MTVTTLKDPMHLISGDAAYIYTHPSFQICVMCDAAGHTTASGRSSVNTSEQFGLRLKAFAERMIENDSLYNTLLGAFVEAHLCAYFEKKPCTLAFCLILNGRTCVVGNEGDAHAYLFKNGNTFEDLTPNTTYKPWNLTGGMLGREQVCGDPIFNVRVFELEPEDIIGLATDGFADNIEIPPHVTTPETNIGKANQNRYEKFFKPLLNKDYSREKLCEISVRKVATSQVKPDDITLALLSPKRS